MKPSTIPNVQGPHLRAKSPVHLEQVTELGSLTKPWRAVARGCTYKEAIPKHCNSDVGSVSNLHFYIFNQICARAIREIEQGNANQARAGKLLVVWHSGRQTDFSGFTERSRARLYRIVAKPSAPGCLLFSPGVF